MKQQAYRVRKTMTKGITRSDALLLQIAVVDEQALFIVNLIDLKPMHWILPSLTTHLYDLFIACLFVNQLCAVIICGFGDREWQTTRRVGLAEENICYCVTSFLTETASIQARLDIRVLDEVFEQYWSDLLASQTLIRRQNPAYTMNNDNDVLVDFCNGFDQCCTVAPCLHVVPITKIAFHCDVAFS